MCLYKIKKKGTLKKNKILNKLKKHLGSHKIPKEIIILGDTEKLKDIPKGPTKKILYRKLKEYYEKEKVTK